MTKKHNSLAHVKKFHILLGAYPIPNEYQQKCRESKLSKNIPDVGIKNGANDMSNAVVLKDKYFFSKMDCNKA